MKRMIRSATARLISLARLVGGEWWRGQNFQVLELGIGPGTIRFRSCSGPDSCTRVGAKGFRYRHALAEVIRSRLTAIDLPHRLFEYRRRFEQNRLVGERLKYSDEGMKSRHHATWEFIGDDGNTWRLSQVTTSGLQQQMSGVLTTTTSDVTQ